MTKKDYYDIGFESKVFKVPKAFLNKYKKDVTLLAKKEVIDDFKSEIDSLPPELTPKQLKVQIWHIIPIIEERHLPTIDKLKKYEKIVSKKDCPHDDVGGATVCNRCGKII